MFLAYSREADRLAAEKNSRGSFFGGVFLPYRRPSVSISDLQKDRPDRLRNFLPVAAERVYIHKEQRLCGGGCVAADKYPTCIQCVACTPNHPPKSYEALRRKVQGGKATTHTQIDTQIFKVDL